MKKLILALMVLSSGCATLDSKSRKTGDCIMYYNTVQLGDEMGVGSSGEKSFGMDIVDSGEMKVRCPNQPKMFEYRK